MTKYTTVIEISSQWLKLVTAKSTLAGHEIIKVITEQVGGLDTKVVSQNLCNRIAELKFIPSPLVISFPRSLVTMRNLHLPSHDTKEIEGMIELHMGRQVPYPKEEIVSSHQILGTDESGYSKVLLAITHRDALRQLFNILDNAGFFPDRIELSSQGVFSWLISGGKAHLEPGKIYMALDIDTSFTDFMIVDKDNLLFSRSINYTAEQISSEDSSRTKFISEMKQSIAIFQSEEVNKKPEKIFISGALGNIGGLPEFLEAELNVPAEVIKPQVAADNNISISGVLGLALERRQKRLNFVLPEAQIRHALKEKGKDLILLGSLVMVALLVASGVFFEKMYNRQSYLKVLGRKFTEVGEDVGKLEIMSKKIALVRERLYTRNQSLVFLYQLNKLIPTEIIIKMINFEADTKVTLRGQARQMSDVFKFITSLEKSGYFKDVQTKYTTGKKVGDKDINEFELVCPLIKTKK